LNSTVTLNLAQGDDVAFSGRGGGIAAATQGMTTTLTVINSTLAHNEATSGGGGVASLGIITGTTATVSLGNTLVQYNVLVEASPSTDALNDVVQLAATTVITGSDGCLAEGGALTSLGFNAEDGDTCGLTANGDLPNMPVSLQPLAFNGGPTQTYLHFLTSAAFNGGSTTLCALAGNVDQRGVTRPQGLNCDIGAVELVPGFWQTRFPRMVLRYQTP
jgi:hypothetical protein